jgi:hypothetical protein
MPISGLLIETGRKVSSRSAGRCPTTPRENMVRTASAERGRSTSKRRFKSDLAKVTVKKDGPAFVAQDMLQRHNNGGEPVLVGSVGALTGLKRTSELVAKEDPKGS